MFITLILLVLTTASWQRVLSFKVWERWQWNLHLKIIIVILAVSVLVNFLQDRIPLGPPFPHLRKGCTRWPQRSLPAQSPLISTAFTNCGQILPKHPLCWCEDVQKGNLEHRFGNKDPPRISRRDVCHQCWSAVASVDWGLKPRNTERRCCPQRGKQRGQVVCLRKEAGWEKYAKSGQERHFQGRTEGLPFRCIKKMKWKVALRSLVCGREPLKIPQKLEKCEATHYGRRAQENA